MDSFWQVQKRHFLREMRFDSLALLSPDKISSNICSCGSNECTVCTELPFRIISTIGPENIVVAMANSSETIMQNYLKYLKENVTPLLQIFTTASIGKDNSQQFPFVTMKIRALIENQSELEENNENTELGTINHLQQYFEHIQSEVVIYCKYLFIITYRNNILIRYNRCKLCFLEKPLF